MEQKHASTIQIKKLQKGTFQLEHITITVSDGDKPEFLSDPEAYIRKGLIAQKETVNGLKISSGRLDEIKSQVRGSKGPVVVALGIWHCESPPEYASQRVEIKDPFF